MINEENVIVFDIDGTLCGGKKQDQSYLEVEPKEEVLKKLLEYRENNFYIILYTSRQMRTYQGNVGKINANTGKILFEWLDKHNIPYDEIHFGKPWCGKNGFYVDDKAIRPSEFLNLSFEEISELLKKEERGL
ncbi:HAD family hydrolase [Clostridium saccharoperbutylacetonicum]|jgi:capsule biosynthesis phosphatase